MMAMIGGINYGGYDFIPNDEVLAWCRQYPDVFIPITICICRFMKRVKNAGCRCFSIPVSIDLIRLMLLIRCTENAAILQQTLEGNDIWATTLPILEPEIQQKAAALCPWETLTASQKRYMSLKSKTLKKIITAL